MRVQGTAPGATKVEVMVPDGMVLGLNLDRGERFERCLEELTIPLERDDMFFFFTDGVSEAMDDERRVLWGDSGWRHFSRRRPTGSPKRSATACLQELTTFVGGQPQHDDITMVILKIG